MSFFPSSLGGKTPPPAPGSKEEDREKEYKDEGIGGGVKEDQTKPDTAGAGDDKGGQVSPVCFSVFGKVTFLSAQIFIIDSATPPPPSPPPPTSAPVLIGSTVWILNSNSSDDNSNNNNSSSSTGTTTSAYRTTTTTRQPSPPKSTAASPPSSSSSRSPKFFGGRVRKKI